MTNATTPAESLASPPPVAEGETQPVAWPCGIASPSYHDCPNMKDVGGGMDGERYWCAICSKGYYLDYEDMK